VSDRRRKNAQAAARYRQNLLHKANKCKEHETFVLQSERQIQQAGAKINEVRAENDRLRAENDRLRAQVAYLQSK
jgi:polyhydroxyalkanoate synthesis regulator phasin